MCVLRSDSYEMHPMDDKMHNDFHIGKWQWIVYVIKACLFHVLYIYIVYVVKAFITWKRTN